MEGVDDTVEICSSQGVTLPSLVILCQMVRAYVRQSTGKMSPSHPTFQGHSRPSESTLIDQLPVTSY